MSRCGGGECLFSTQVRVKSQVRDKSLCPSRVWMSHGTHECVLSEVPVKSQVRDSFTLVKGTKTCHELDSSHELALLTSPCALDNSLWRCSSCTPAREVVLEIGLFCTNRSPLYPEKSTNKFTSHAWRAHVQRLSCAGEQPLEVSSHPSNVQHAFKYSSCWSTRPYESCKIFKGRPRRNASSKLVHRQYKSFPPDRFCQVERKNPTRLSNKTNNAWCRAEDQILENKNLRNMILNICTER